MVKKKQTCLLSAATMSYPYSLLRFPTLPQQLSNFH